MVVKEVVAEEEMVEEVVAEEEMVEEEAQMILRQKCLVEKTETLK